MEVAYPPSFICAPSTARRPPRYSSSTAAIRGVGVTTIQCAKKRLPLMSSKVGSPRLVRNSWIRTDRLRKLPAVPRRAIVYLSQHRSDPALSLFSGHDYLPFPMPTLPVPLHQFEGQADSTKTLARCRGSASHFSAQASCIL